MKINGSTLIRLADHSLKTVFSQGTAPKAPSKLLLPLMRFHHPLSNAFFANRSITFLPKLERSSFPNSSLGAHQNRNWKILEQKTSAAKFYSSKHSTSSSTSEAFRTATQEFSERLENIQPLSDSLTEMCYRYHNRICIIQNLAKTMPPENLKSDSHFSSLVRLSLQIASSIESLLEQKNTSPKQLEQLKCLYTTASFLADRTEIEILQCKEHEPRTLRQAFNPALVDNAIYKKLTLK